MRKVKCDRFRQKFDAISLRAGTGAIAGYKLGARLLAISDRVVRTKRNLETAGQEEFFAALHHVLLIERPWIHEVLQHDHEHPIRKRGYIQSFRQPAGSAGDGKCIRRGL